MVVSGSLVTEGPVRHKPELSKPWRRTTTTTTSRGVRGEKGILSQESVAVWVVRIWILRVYKGGVVTTDQLPDLASIIVRGPRFYKQEHIDTHCECPQSDLREQTGYFL